MMNEIALQRNPKKVERDFGKTRKEIIWMGRTLQVPASLWSWVKRSSGMSDLFCSALVKAMMASDLVARPFVLERLWVPV